MLINSAALFSKSLDAWTAATSEKHTMSRPAMGHQRNAGSSLGQPAQTQACQLWFFTSTVRVRNPVLKQYSNNCLEGWARLPVETKLWAWRQTLKFLFPNWCSGYFLSSESLDSSSQFCWHQGLNLPMRAQPLGHAQNLSNVFDSSGGGQQRPKQPSLLPRQNHRGPSISDHLCLTG